MDKLCVRGAPWIEIKLNKQSKGSITLLLNVYSDTKSFAAQPLPIWLCRGSDGDLPAVGKKRVICIKQQRQRKPQVHTNCSQCG